jgi:hypothetical protein
LLAKFVVFVISPTGVIMARIRPGFRASQRGVSHFDTAICELLLSVAPQAMIRGSLDGDLRSLSQANCLL